MTRFRPIRESVSTIRSDGSRRAPCPTVVLGKWTRRRQFVAFLLITVFVALPFVSIRGEPALLFDFSARRFHFIGATFATQDLWLGFFLITGLAFSLFFATALFGRIWCGWACPQTIYLEHVFRRIERWIEGDRRKGLRDRKMAVRRCIKHATFLLVSVGLAHVFLSYFVRPVELLAWTRGSPDAHPVAFAFIFGATAVFYGNFVWFREQLCLIVCPYGRLQSTLVDEHTITIGYDERRGEPRGRATNQAAGDCVDCFRCVQVCPTGIDIRHGQQLECIACANCIDACDDTMRRLGRATGLIRYESEAGFSGLRTRLIRPRILIYTALLIIGIGISSTMFVRTLPFHTSITRMAGAPYFVSDDTIRNQFLVRIINKQPRETIFHLQATEGPPELLGSVAAEGIVVEPSGEVITPFIATLARNAWHASFRFELHIVDASTGQKVTQELQFLGPNMN